MWAWRGPPVVTSGTTLRSAAKYERRGITAQAQHPLAGTRPRGDPPEHGRPLQPCQYRGVEQQRVAAPVVETALQVDVVAPQQANDPPADAIGSGLSALGALCASIPLNGTWGKSPRAENAKRAESEKELGPVSALLALAVRAFR